MSCAGMTLLHKLILLYKIINFNTPSYLRDILPVRVNERSRYSLRSNDNFTPISIRTKRFKQSFFPSTVADWNRLDTELRNATPLSSFKNRLRNTYSL